MFACKRASTCVYIVMAYVVMAYVIMAYVVMAYVVMAISTHKRANTAVLCVHVSIHSFAHVCRFTLASPPILALYRVYIGIADGMSVARV